MIDTALVIDSPWIEKILNGEKVWELRSKNSKRRGWIGLVRKGSGLVVGAARMIDVRGPLSLAELEASYHLHRVPLGMLTGPFEKYRIAFVFADLQKLARPVPYRHRLGAVTWVGLDPEVGLSLQKQLSLSA